jgi:hypothetical protein
LYQLSAVSHRRGQPATDRRLPAKQQHRWLIADC